MSTERSPFDLREDGNDLEIRLFVAGPIRHRLIRWAIASVLPCLIVGLTLHQFPQDLAGAVGTAVAIYVAVLIWEMYEVRASVQDQTLHLKLKPGIYGWLATDRISLAGVTRVRARAAFLQLYRGSDWELAFVPLPHLTTSSGETAAERIARLIEGQLPGEDVVAKGSLKAVERNALTPGGDTFCGCD